MGGRNGSIKIGNWDPEEDSVVIYTFLTEKYSRREILGKSKAVTDVII